MIDDELINKFESIEDLPIPEKILGAYLEGNLSPSEIYDVESVFLESNCLYDFTTTNIGYVVDLGNSFDSDIDDFKEHKLNIK